MLIHKNNSELKGKQAKTKSGKTIHVKDWWDRLVRKSWKDMTGNPACLKYALRRAVENLPMDDEVLYCHTEDGIGNLFHISELE